ncbi:AAA family ATPase [Chitinophaga varians]|uniref:AAA family ATPase n=1 Tax=Chitinophaga varians TaxID=2202339 RepID=A0A847RAN2_9BACT|nr:AAA family ATPase [Chitinophaga varians]NLR63130.1 AAA family ATPase [Chitinophaga varians]
MQSRLIVKDFGPIEFVDLDLRNVNVFIGPQASGKSALAKLYTIFKAPRKFIKEDRFDIVAEPQEVNWQFREVLEEYNISSFLKNGTEIEFTSELHSISYRKGKITYTPLLLNRIEMIEELKENFEENRANITYSISDLASKFIGFSFRTLKILGADLDFSVFDLESRELTNLTKGQFSEIIKVIKETEANLSTNAALYIPAERNFVNIVKNASFNLLLHNVPIPKHILAFGAEVEKASIEDIDLSFLQKDLVYKNINGEDRIFTSTKHSIKLTEAASGVQSVLPLLIPILAHKDVAGHRSFVIEEPELNLFPLAQYELIKKLESSRNEPYWEDSGSIHTYTTHSPYILSALNNLLYANKVKDSILSSDLNRKEFYQKVNNVVSAEIDPDYFTAYQVSNGMAESIFDRENGLIIDNFIDKASDKLSDDFDALMELAN